MWNIDLQCGHRHSAVAIADEGKDTQSRPLTSDSRSWNFLFKTSNQSLLNKLRKKQYQFLKLMQWWTALKPQWLGGLSLLLLRLSWNLIWALYHKENNMDRLKALSGVCLRFSITISHCSLDCSVVSEWNWYSTLLSLWSVVCLDEHQHLRRDRWNCSTLSLKIKRLKLQWNCILSRIWQEIDLFWNTCKWNRNLDFWFCTMHYSITRNFQAEK